MNLVNGIDYDYILEEFNRERRNRFTSKLNKLLKVFLCDHDRVVCLDHILNLTEESETYLLDFLRYISNERTILNNKSLSNGVIGGENNELK